MIAPPRRRFGAAALLAPVLDLFPSRILLRRGPPSRRAVALTFDDGPDGMTREYLDCLDSLGVRATFFVIGKSCSDRAADIAEMHRRGHEVCGHGYSHRPLPKLTSAEIRDELKRTASLLPPSKLVRPPFGSLSPRSLAQVAMAGFTTVMWSLDSDDCRTQNPDDVVARVAPSRIKPGEIVLLHEGQRWTLDALPPLVRALKEAGYSFSTISDLLRA